MEATSAIIDPKTHTFSVPVKVINDEESLAKFKQSTTYFEYIGFACALQASVQGSKISECEKPSNLARLHSFLDWADKLMEDVPPIQQPMRFGNKAFRTWMDKIKEAYEPMMKELLPDESYHVAIPELGEYFLDAFGSYERIDYGTGHEMNFVAFLYCLFRLGLYTKEEFKGLVNCVFERYLLLMRKIQTTYFLEPAGSHGVWGLDDYQFLSFLFGAGALVKHEMFTPDSIHDDSVIAKYHADYMYFGCIKFIKEVKKGVPFGESSPLLNDISGVPTWEKVSQGLVKMYKAEVMDKWPVIKHFRFGSIIQFK